jgi:transposase
MILTTRQAILVSRTKAINELKGLIVAAPEQLRSDLRAARWPGSLIASKQ